MNRWTHFFIKIYISHTLFLMFLWCVRDEWRQGQTAILTQLLLLIMAALLLHLGWGCSTGGRWRPQPSVCKLALTLAFLSPTPTCFCFFFRLFTLVHLWLTTRSKVNIQQYSLIYAHNVHMQCKFTHAHIYVQISLWMYTYIHAQTYIHIYIYIYTNLWSIWYYIYMYTHLLICLPWHTYTHTYTHTYPCHNTDSVS